LTPNTTILVPFSEQTLNDFLNKGMFCYLSASLKDWASAFRRPKPLTGTHFKKKEETMKKRNIAVAAVTFLLLGTSFAGTKASPDELCVRKAYANLAFGSELDTVHKNLRKGVTLNDLEAKLSARALKFHLLAFSSGPVEEIAKRTYSELVTKPDGQDVLAVVVVQFKHTDDIPETREVREKTEFNTDPKWMAGQTVIEDWNIPFEKMLAAINKQNNSVYSRYVSYKATVTFEGKSRTYNAMFLFGSGDVPILALDNVTNNSALTFFASNEAYPTTLLETSLSQRPLVSDWLKAHQIVDARCEGGHKKVCCNPDTLTCGVSADDVRASTNKPITKLFPHRGIFRPVVLTDCSDADYGSVGASTSDSDPTEHQNGDHNWHDQPTGLCEYTGPAPQSNQCIATVTASPHVSASEMGGIVNGGCHVLNGNGVGGSASGATPSASAAGAVAVKSCAGCGCTFSISFNGTNPVFPAGAMWTKQDSYTDTCVSRSITSGSPIVVDTTGQGFRLTSEADGVDFDLTGTGHPVHTSWTDERSGNAFLVLDRNGNGKIDSGKELFGNYTDQPPSDDRNGFLALFVFDVPSKGGNGDEVIDARDAIWTQLKLWMDENHDGVSQPDELHSLQELGIVSIGLKYHQIRHYDEFGNLFRYKGVLNPGLPASDQVGRSIFDVFFVIGDNPTSDNPVAGNWLKNLDIR
jgi:hypothetical protein